MTTFLALPHEKKKRILDSIMKECCIKGLKHASTVSMAKGASIAKGAFFHYFGTKEKALEYTVNYAMERVYHMVEEHFPKDEEDLVELLMAISQIKVRLAKEHPLLFEFLYRFYLDDAGANYRSKVEEVMGLFEQRIAVQVDHRRFKDGMDLSIALELATWISEGIGKKYASLYEELDPDHLMQYSLPYLEHLRTLIYGDEHEHH